MALEIKSISISVSEFTITERKYEVQLIKNSVIGIKVGLIWFNKHYKSYSSDWPYKTFYSK